MSEAESNTIGNKDIDSNARLLALLNAAVDAFVIIDERGTIELFNHAAEMMFGYSCNDVLGKNVAILMPSDIASQHDNYLMNYIQTSDSKVIGKSRKVMGRKFDGNEFPINISVGEVLESSHRQFVGIIRDMSEQEKIKAEAQENRERLSHAARLNAAGELAAGIAHEMNQPLTAITSYAQASRRLLRTPNDGNLSRVKGALDKICDQALRTSEVLNQLRTFVKKRTGDRKHIELNQTIRETINLAQIDTRISQHNVILELEENNQPILLANQVQIQQVLLNLIRNGLDAMEKMEGSPLKITSQWLSEQTIEVSVIDCGDGLEENISKQVFTPFYTTKETGMGMGLPISQTIIHAHGGDIYIKNTNDSLTNFSFSLPATSMKSER